MIKREFYLSQVRQFIGTPFIKVLSGLRRCGKSSILEMIREELLDSGVTEEDIIFINFETYDEGELNAKDVSRQIKEHCKKRERVYLLLDEVQLLPGWERVVNAAFAGKKTDIFITGSNSRLLSSELATLLSGRYVQFTIRTLSFTEYIDFIQKGKGKGKVSGRAAGDSTSLFWDYLRQGGFPGIHYLRSMESSMVYKTVSDIFSAVVLKDVIQRNKLRNVDLLERIIRFLFDNTGNMVSARGISDYFKNQKRTVSVDTVLEYIVALESSYSIEKVRRYDIRGKKLLNVREKYYSGDIAFIHALLGYDDRRLPGILENIVYGELRRRSYEVFVGQYGDKEIDFVATKENEKIYVQVCYLINNDEAVINREFGNLLKIKDQYPKYVLSLDANWSTNISGVRHCYIPDFLRNANSLA